MAAVGRVVTGILAPSMLERHVFTCTAMDARNHGTTTFDETLTLLRSTKQALAAWVHVDIPADPVTDSPSHTTSPLTDNDPFADDGTAPVRSVKRLALLFSLRSGMALMRLVCEEHQTSVLDGVADEGDHPCEDDASHSEFLHQWFSNNLATDIANVIFADRGDDKARSQLPEATLYVWDPDIDRDRLTKKTARQQASQISPKHTSPQAAKVAPRTPRRDSRDLITCSSMEDLTTTVRQECLGALYVGQHAAHSFVKDVVPTFWDAIDSMACGEVGAPSPSRRKFRKAKTRLGMLEFLCKDVLLSVAQLEQKYRSILDMLDEPPDPQASTTAPALLHNMECAAVKAWWKEIHDHIPVGQLADTRRILRQEVNKLRLFDTKLQMIWLLECLRAKCEMDVQLPDISLWFATAKPASPDKEVRRKRKSKSVIDDFIVKPFKRRKVDEKSQFVPVDEGPDPPVPHLVPPSQENGALFVRAVEELMDRMCISNAITAVESANTSSLLKDFVEPVVVKYYNSYLPDLVKSLVLKAGGDPAVQQAVPPSPFFKKKRGSGRDGSKKRDGSTRGPSSSKRKAVTETKPPPRKASDFLKGLGKRQMVVGKPKSKTSKSNGLQRHDSSRSISTSLASQSSEPEHPKSAGTVSLPTFGKRITAFKNQHTGALPRDSAKTHGRPLMRTLSLPAIPNDSENPFWEDPHPPPRKNSGFDGMLAARKRSSASSVPALPPVPLTLPKPFPARPFAQFARTKTSSDPNATSPLKPNLQHAMLRPPDEQSSSVFLTTPKKRGGRRASLDDYGSLENDVDVPETPIALRRAGARPAEEDDAENGFFIADTPLSKRFAKALDHASPGTPTRPYSPESRRQRQSSPSPIEYTGSFQVPSSPSRPEAPTTPSRPRLLERIQSARSSLTIKSPYNPSPRRSTPKKRKSHTTPRKQLKASLPPRWPAPSTPSKRSDAQAPTPSKVRFTASPPLLKIVPATPPPRPGKRGAGGGDRSATPLATPGSCKRLQSMLEGFADSDWDEFD
ncbi:hypothetical protein HDU86_006877 [Geranomyces michiganensis]|nr:hypothetical protein HDU86_006877 [Geranomyces michiganensis]